MTTWWLIDAIVNGLTFIVGSVLTFVCLYGYWWETTGRRESERYWRKREDDEDWKRRRSRSRRNR